MSKNGFRIIDSDMHVMEPTDLWERYIDPAYSDRSPKSVPRHRGDLVMRVEGREMAAEAQWEIELADDPNWLASYADGLANGWDGPSQRRAMDSEGLDLAILYPSRGLYALAVDGMDPALASAIAVAYNDWLFDFCAADRARMLGAGMVSPFDVGSAVEEARRSVKEMGFKAVFTRPNVVNGRNWYDRYYDPLWAEIEDLNVPLGFHEGSDAGVPQTGDQFLTDSWLMHHTCTHPMEMMLALVSMVGGGVLARFPRLRVGFLEGNCSWGTLDAVAFGRALRACRQARVPGTHAGTDGVLPAAVLGLGGGGRRARPIHRRVGAGGERGILHGLSPQGLQVSQGRGGVSRDWFF